LILFIAVCPFVTCFSAAMTSLIQLNNL